MKPNNKRKGPQLMTTFPLRRRLILAILALVTALTGTALATAAPASASFLNDAIIQNQSYSYYTITVCHDAASTTSCVPGHYGFLAPGQNVASKYGWTDSDGIWCQRGWWCKVFSNYFEGTGTGWGSQFIKIGGCDGCTAPVYVWKDNNPPGA